MTLQPPCGTTVLRFVLEQTAINNVLNTFDEKFDERKQRKRLYFTFEQSKTQEKIDPIPSGKHTDKENISTAAKMDYNFTY